jgi:hypothetical protein
MDFVKDIIRRNVENRIENQKVIEDIMRIYKYYYNNRTSSITTEWEPDPENEFIISRIGFLLNDRPQATIDIQQNTIDIIYHNLENVESKIHSKYIKESYKANKKIIKIQQ